MLTNEPSRTALRAALRRAAHQVMDEPLVFEDPLALPIAGVDDVRRFRQNLLRGENESYRALRAFLVARSRFAQDKLTAALDAGLRQYVLLGAGFDTSAYRLPALDGLRSFEVDHPATQEAKRQRLHAAGIDSPSHLTFVPVDFENESAASALAGAGFNGAEPALFCWLGVVPYLREAAIFKTLGWIASLVEGTAVIFDYGEDPNSLPGPLRARFNVLSARVAAIGEPWLSFFEPAELERRLRGLGFTAIEDLSSVEINGLYFRDRHDRLRTAGIGHLIYAQR